MVATAPHYLLLSETADDADQSRGGFWRFALQNIDGSELLEVSDREPEIRGERLQLLAVIRGLEALDQPSRVTVITSSKYVTRGIRYGLPSWKENDWRWERFGEMLPIKNRDLWQRMDRALALHDIQCRAWQRRPARTIALGVSPMGQLQVGQSRRGFRQRSRFGHSGRFGPGVLEQWADAARKIRNRTTMETLAGASCA